MKPWHLMKLLYNLEQLRRHERWTRPQLQEYQAESLRRLREYAYARSPFYQRFHRGLFERPLHELPVLTKAMVMEHFDELVTDRAIHLDAVRAFAAAGLNDRLFLDRYRVPATSGSSGQPGFFVFGETEWLTIMAAFGRAQQWSGPNANPWRRRKMAMVTSVSPFHLSSLVGASAKSWFTPSTRLPASEPLETIVQRLNEIQPDLLVTFASLSRILAEEQLAGRLHIRPDKIFTSSEVLPDETRRRIKLAWGNEPFNQYGATETAGIAVEHFGCRHMHLYEDLVIFEVVDEHYRPVPAGTFGAKLLATTLFSRTQPLIRYEMNDSVCLGTETCSSGLPFVILESIQGRIEEQLHLPAKTGGRTAIQPLVFKRIMDILPISGWQVVQEADDGLTVLLSGVRDASVESTLADALTQALISQGAIVPAVRIQPVSSIPKASSGKTPQIKAYRPVKENQL